MKLPPGPEALECLQPASERKRGPSRPPKPNVNEVSSGVEGAAASGPTTTTATTSTPLRERETTKTDPLTTSQKTAKLTATLFNM